MICLCLSYSISIDMPGPGSTTRKCVVCNTQLNIARKICKTCKAEQPQKLRLTKKLEMFDQKRESWIHTRQKNRTSSHIRDQAYMLVCDCFYCFHAVQFISSL